MEIGLLIVRLILFGVLAVAGVAKILDRDGSKTAFAAFGVPAALTKPLVYLLPVIEIVTAMALLFLETSWFGAIGAAALFLIFTAGMLYQLAKGNAPECHCFGQMHSKPVGASSVLRNLFLFALAFNLIVMGRSNQGLSLTNLNQDAAQFLVSIAIVGLLTAVMLFLKKISEQQKQIMQRIEMMEIVARDGGMVEREDLSHPHDGLPIGAQFPEFRLPDAEGNFVSLGEIRLDARPTLFLFVSPTCNPCKALVPEFEQWQKDLVHKVKFVFISNGKPDENLKKFGGDLSKQILLQKEREVAESVKAQWTPTAILMDANGRLASHATAGDTAIRELVEQIKLKDLSVEYTHFTNGHDHGQTNLIGRSVPQFTQKDIKGQIINSDYFKGKQTLVTFWSLTCPHCTTMMKELKAWDAMKGKDEPSLVVFSDGDKVTLETYGLRSPVVLDEGHMTSAGFGMFGTPSAVLVNEEGRIASETATGAPNIWSLIGRPNGK